MSHIPLKRASEILGVEDSAIVTSNRYKPFYKKSDKGTRNASFDLQGYLKYEETKETLTEKVKLMVEYLHHIEEVSYMSLSRMTGIHIQAIALLTFGYKNALKLAIYVREFMPFHFKRFDEYYGWRPSIKEPIVRHTPYGWRLTNVD